MRKIIVIGTVHGGFTPNNELQDVLENFKPGQLLVEIAEEDIKKDNLKEYPSEMICAYNWAKKRKIPVNGFDSTINVLAEGITEEHNKKAIKIQLKRIERYTWKDLNKEEYLKMVDSELLPPPLNQLIDEKKMKQREKEMVKNIKKYIHKKGDIIIITGAGNLKIFEKEFPNAIFPYRK